MKWLILDCNFLCHRAFHAIPHLTHNDVAVGVAFGFLRDIPLMQKEHGTKNIVFCFDDGLGQRRAIDPGYKRNRQDKYNDLTPDEQKTMQEFRRQVRRLRDKYLPFLGFKNILHQRGYEADDMIASVARDLPGKQEGVIIGSDQDLWQCLAPNISMYNPITRRTMTHELFRKTWDISPDQWSHVKAFAGCSSDGVVGVRGIGEKTAAKWVAGRLKPDTKAYQKIQDGLEVFNTNIQLVKLPMAGTNEFVLRTDMVTDDKWQALGKRLGIKALKEARPRGVRQRNGKEKNKKNFGLGSTGSP